ncbi:hypothetical protein A2454_00285 [Candidatus Peribacteria bacterium RIFOXYC2_FULL_55_14]|nr:MAG: hypothetical protein UY85_C0029G0006 [Candidatus Peribacteria bacterium GW2011_GWB1_54_5]KKW40949.1 MAG: hypothetical protein UY87_C0007G0003 [Candidatus Peribacteria bacterium GW2011_GWC2_54_8]OGJ73116.1 MAG: hypothetical protein A2198_03075 [Candidatus Peribacteria bacterium RIFOXYA1_FULL_56_14]OGJ73885.1 MAG: hypothetical protein A2217_04050 [Candidatus Peribacteria bacterium RIFOXYA2_FULL_55_28]OGJ75728.1 MAG: hypothetical protein A2384_05520 [Candidatus Peribacteria bacterium RIFOX
MKRTLFIAVALQVFIMVLVLIPPLIVTGTGTHVFLETRRVDPRELFRGDYVILDYPIGDQVPLDLAREAYEGRDSLYITVTTDRPATFVQAGLQRPELQPGQACIVARADESVRWDWAEGTGRSSVFFPQISQYFVPEGEGKELETNLENMVAEVVASSRCNAVVVDLELL